VRLPIARPEPPTMTPDEETAALMGGLAVLLDRAGGAVNYTPDEYERVTERFPAGVVFGVRDGIVHLYLARERGEVLES
jgi:hypothetical protein